MNRQPKAVRESADIYKAFCLRTTFIRFHGCSLYQAAARGNQSFVSKRLTDYAERLIQSASFCSRYCRGVVP